MPAFSRNSLDQHNCITQRSFRSCHGRLFARGALPPRTVLANALLPCFCRTDPFAKKDWYDIKAPSTFSTRNVGKTLVTRTAGTKVSGPGAAVSQRCMQSLQLHVGAATMPESVHGG